MLTRFGMMAEKSWKTNRPKMVRHLIKKGVLRDALEHNQEMAKEELADWVRKGASGPHVEMDVLKKWILLPDEKTVKRLPPDQMPYSQP